MREKMQRFDIYMKTKQLNDNQVTEQCNLSQGLLGQARTGKCDLGPKTIEKILKVYQDLNKVWLLTGEGDMIISGDIHGDHNAVAGRDASVSVTDAGIIEKFLAEIAEQRKLTEAQQRLMGASQCQVDRLLGIIEEMTKRMG